MQGSSTPQPEQDWYSRVESAALEHAANEKKRRGVLPASCYVRISETLNGPGRIYLVEFSPYRAPRITPWNLFA